MKRECADLFTVPRVCACYLLISLLLMGQSLLAAPQDAVLLDRALLDRALLDRALLDSQLEKRGEWLHEYMGWIDVFSVTLYDDPSRRGERALGPVPKHLTVRYHRDVSAQQFAEITSAGIAENVSPEILARLQDRISEFNRLYVAVERGDRYDVFYWPARGMELRHNGKLLGFVEGDDFAEAWFSIWLGGSPVDVRMRAALLGD